MARDARFWRNVAIITGVHLLVFLGLARASRDSDKANLQSIVWMNAADTIAAASSASAATEEAAKPSPDRRAKAEALPTPTPSKSEIVLPSPTPTATVPPKPSASPTPKSSPSPTPKLTPKATPKKSVTPPPKPTPKASPEKEKVTAEKTKTPEEKKNSNKQSGPPSDKPVEKSESPGTGSGTGAAKTSEHAWYGSMLHDRFYKAWEQPTTSVPTGAKMSTIVKIRIEKDGKVSKFTIVKPSGSVIVDESVSAIAERVTQVDPVPEGLTKNSFYEVKIDFELNAEK